MGADDSEEVAQGRSLVLCVLFRACHASIVAHERQKREFRQNDDMSNLDPNIASRLKRNEAGLIAVIAQQWDTGEVLMLAWMDDEALARTLKTGDATYFSRSRNEYWVKGATSGNTQRVRELRLDCDGDALLLKVDQTGVACHTGTRTCFDDGELENS